MVPIAAPLESVAVHVVQTPGIGGITADLCSPTKRWPRLGPVVRLAFEVCLFAAELVAEGCRCRCSRAARVLPLCLGGQPKFPIVRQLARLMAQLGESLAEGFGFGEIHVSHWKVVTFR